MEDIKLSNKNFIDLLKMKKKNLSKQAELRKESEALDRELATRQEILETIGDLNESGGSKRVKLDGLIPLDLRVQYRVTRSWDQEHINKIKSDVPEDLFPFRTEYVEDTKKIASLIDNNPDIYNKVQEGLQTRLNERPYISFVEPTKQK